MKNGGRATMCKHPAGCQKNANEAVYARCMVEKPFGASTQLVVKTNHTKVASVKDTVEDIGARTVVVRTAQPVPIFV